MTKREKIIHFQFLLWILLFAYLILFRFEETIGFGLIIPDWGKVILVVVVVLILFFVRRKMLNSDFEKKEKSENKREDKFLILTFFLFGMVLTFFIIQIIAQNN